MTTYPKSYNTSISFYEMSMRKPPGRSYKFFSGEPVYEFGVGESYTTWEVTPVNSSAAVGDDDGDSGMLGFSAPGEMTSFSTAALASASGVAYRVQVKNTGNRAGSYVALAFLSPPNASDLVDGANSYMTIAPKKQLFGFGRVSLEPGQSQVVDFLLQLNARVSVSENGSNRWTGSSSRAETPIDYSSASVDSAGRRIVYPGMYKIQVTDAQAQYFEAIGEPAIVSSEFE